MSLTGSLPGKFVTLLQGGHMGTWGGLGVVFRDPSQARKHNKINHIHHTTYTSTPTLPPHATLARVVFMQRTGNVYHICVVAYLSLDCGIPNMVVLYLDSRGK